jgi:sedoheptulokinase
VCTIAAWLASELTSQPPVTDPTFAASWGIYSLAEAAWNAPFLERLGIDARLLPPILPSGKALGGLQSGIARQVGLPAGVPIHNAVGDTQASFLGACMPPEIFRSDNGGLSDGTVGGLARVIFLNIGTGGQICWTVPRFQPPAEAVETRPLLPGCYLRVGASLCGGAAYAWLNRTVRAWLSEFGHELEEDAVYERLNTLAAESTPGHGLRVRPTFLGVRGDPAIEAGAIEGIVLDNMQLGALARATLAGMVEELHALYDEHAGPLAHYREVVAAGGAVQRNPLLPGLIEERFGLPVRIPAHQETAAIGAVMARGQTCPGTPSRL